MWSWEQNMREIKAEKILDAIKVVTEYPYIKSINEQIGQLKQYAIPVAIKVVTSAGHSLYKMGEDAAPYVTAAKDVALNRVSQIYANMPGYWEEAKADAEWASNTYVSPLLEKWMGNLTFEEIMSSAKSKIGTVLANVEGMKAVDKIGSIGVEEMEAKIHSVGSAMPSEVKLSAVESVIYSSAVSEVGSKDATSGGEVVEDGNV